MARAQTTAATTAASAKPSRRSSDVHAPLPGLKSAPGGVTSTRVAPAPPASPPPSQLQLVARRASSASRAPAVA